MILGPIPNLIAMEHAKVRELSTDIGTEKTKLGNAYGIYKEGNKTFKASYSAPSETSYDKAVSALKNFNESVTTELEALQEVVDAGAGAYEKHNSNGIIPFVVL